MVKQSLCIHQLEIGIFDADRIIGLRTAKLSKLQNGKKRMANGQFLST
jgi:hypothetical protein